MLPPLQIVLKEQSQPTSPNHAKGDGDAHVDFELEEHR